MVTKNVDTIGESTLLHWYDYENIFWVDENRRLLWLILWQGISDEKNLMEFIGRTKEDLERIKQDKDFILKVTWKESICVSDLMDLRKMMSKDYEKYIFDLDNTLLIPDWSCEDDYFRNNILPEKQNEFFNKKQKILDEYEIIFSKYDAKTLSDYFRGYGFAVSEDVINGWMKYNGENIKDVVADWVIDFFEYLKERGKKIIVLTSRFKGTQIPRLERIGIMKYIDKIIAGDDAMKPNIESFNLAIGKANKSDCVMIGDSIRSDKTGANNAGIDCCIVGGGYNVRNLFDIIRESERLRQKKKNEQPYF